MQEKEIKKISGCTWKLVRERMGIEADPLSILEHMNEENEIRGFKGEGRKELNSKGS